MVRTQRPRFQFTWLQIVTHLGALAPLAVMFWDGAHNGLTVNPIQSLTFRTGKTALVLLVLSLCCTPLNSIFGFRWAIKLRRPLGVYAFLYVLGHLSIFLFDFNFDPAMLYTAIFNQLYVLVGFAAFLILLPLALTSTKGWQKRLGKSWTTLHKFVYLAAVLVIIHFIWLVKADIRQPLEFGAVLAALFAVRIPAVKHALRAVAQVLVPRGRGPRMGSKRAVPEAAGSND
jgi:methionine sulfoxide reductase heme-binding subunit